MFDLARTSRSPGAPILGGRRVSPEAKALYDDFERTMWKLQGERLVAGKRMGDTMSLCDEAAFYVKGDPLRQMLALEVIRDYNAKAHAHQMRYNDYGA